MQLRLPILSMLLASSSVVSATTVCRPNEIGVGIFTTCNLGNPIQGPGSCRYVPTLFSDDCQIIDNAKDGDTDWCEGGWGRGVVNCAPNKGVWNVHIDGSTYGSWPADGHAGCYQPTKHSGYCADAPFGSATVSWCCPRL